MESYRGLLLVSSPSLHDPNFRRTVVLITHHDEDGAMGLVLTRPSEALVTDAVPVMAELAGPDEVVHVGGPVQPQAVVVLAELEQEHESFEPVLGGVGFLPLGVEAEELAVARVRVFAGYSGWGPGQLEGEMAESSWIVVPAEPDDVFADDPDELWRTVVQRKGGRFSLMESMPFDPDLN
jgi:putative transcriptional regulator